MLSTPSVPSHSRQCLCPWAQSQGSGLAQPQRTGRLRALGQLTRRHGLLTGDFVQLYPGLLKQSLVPHVVAAAGVKCHTSGEVQSQSLMGTKDLLRTAEGNPPFGSAGPRGQWGAPSLLSDTRHSGGGGGDNKQTNERM